MTANSQQNDDRLTLELVVLGSANAVPDDTHENSHLALSGSKRLVLIDCTGNPIVRLKQAGLEYQHLSDLILTHFHPDHVSAVPTFLMNLWLLGRRDPLRLHGLEHTLQRMRQMMELFDWGTWPGFYPVVFHPLPEQELFPVIEGGEFSIYSSPVRHIIPTIGLRFTSHISHRSIAYSADTEPCPEVVRLANGCDILIHEATGEYYGHSSAAQAGAAARQSGAGRLVLIHYSTVGGQSGSLVEEASTNFDGPVSLAEDFMRVEF